MENIIKNILTDEFNARYSDRLPNHLKVVSIILVSEHGSGVRFRFLEGNDINVNCDLPGNVAFDDLGLTTLQFEKTQAGWVLNEKAKYGDDGCKLGELLKIPKETLLLGMFDYLDQALKEKKPELNVKNSYLDQWEDGYSIEDSSAVHDPLREPVERLLDKGLVHIDIVLSPDESGGHKLEIIGYADYDPNERLRYQEPYVLRKRVEETYSIKPSELPSGFLNHHSWVRVHFNPGGCQSFDNEAIVDNPEFRALCARYIDQYHKDKNFFIGILVKEHEEKRAQEVSSKVQPKVVSEHSLGPSPRMLISAGIAFCIISLFAENWLDDSDNSLPKAKDSGRVTVEYEYPIQFAESNGLEGLYLDSQITIGKPIEEISNEEFIEITPLTFSTKFDTDSMNLDENIGARFVDGEIEYSFDESICGIKNFLRSELNSRSDNGGQDCFIKVRPKLVYYMPPSNQTSSGLE